MMNFSIVKFDETVCHLLPRVRQSFDIIGRLIPEYDGAEWSVSEELFGSVGEKTYPEESFDAAEYIDNPDRAIFLAVQNGEFAGSIRVHRNWNNNAFVDDLAVDRECRGLGAGKLLMDSAVKWVNDNGMNGISLETQDNNLLACRFYLKYGFKIGGIDTKIYASPYEDETALYFYLMPEN